MFHRGDASGSLETRSRLELPRRQGEHMLQVGDVAPVFSLPDADMEVFDLESALGKRHIVLYFYPRANTPGCTLQAADFSDHEDDFARYDCEVIGISPDDCLTNAEFRDLHGLSLRLLSDEDCEVCRLYDVCRSKRVDGIEQARVARTTFIIDKLGVIRHVLRDVSPRGHAANVFNMVRNLETEYANGNR